jgi:hypothetical protein
LVLLPGGVVKKVSEYLKHAAECRELARQAIGRNKQQLEDMAETWENLAHARRVLLKKRGILEQDDDGRELY